MKEIYNLFSSHDTITPKEKFNKEMEKESLAVAQKSVKHLKMLQNYGMAKIWKDFSHPVSI